ncbi:MAG: hypothetical protein ABUL48_00490, partial [Pseudorhodoplanes sp.]
RGYRMIYLQAMTVRTICLAFLLAGFVLPASAEVEKFMAACDGKLCPQFRLKFTPPAGWTQDMEATKENGTPIYVPKGKDFGRAPALMYIRVTYNSDRRSLEEFIKVAHERWRAAVKDSKIDRLASEKRTNGQPDFQIYHFFNPDRPQQAYEMMAYGEDKDKDGNAFFLMIGLTAARQKALDDAEPAYRAGLHAH